MKATVTGLRAAALGSFILVMPLAILEAINTTLTRQNVPGLLILFGFLWVLPTAALVVLIPVVRNARTINSLNPLRLLLGAAVVLVVAFIWGSLVADQMPCFLGVPNCD